MSRDGEAGLFMVIERFRAGPDAVYERFAERGRMLPAGLEYVDSWVDRATNTTCYQLMRTADVTTFDSWIAEWSDLVDFEVIEVVTSAEASAR